MLNRGYIFDLDGTLVNSYPEIYRAFEMALSGIGEPSLSKSRLAPLIGTSMSVVIDELFPEWSNEKRDTFRQKFGELYDAVCDQSQAFEGAGEMLRFLEGRYVIVSNKPRGWSERLVTALGWKPLALICPGPTMARKPSPDMLFEGVRRLRESFDAETVVTIGDSIADQMAAERANLTFFQVAWSYHKTICDGVVSGWADFLREMQADTGGRDVYLGAPGLSRD